VRNVTINNKWTQQRGSIPEGSFAARWEHCMNGTSFVVNTAPSDARMKHQVTDLDASAFAEALLSNLRPVSFLMQPGWEDMALNGKSATQYGFIAQELRAVAPPLVCLVRCPPVGPAVIEDLHIVNTNYLPVYNTLCIVGLLNRAQTLFTELEATQALQAQRLGALEERMQVARAQQQS
jgi:hypothetical protein